jgi:hypothetical protein
MLGWYLIWYLGISSGANTGLGGVRSSRQCQVLGAGGGPGVLASLSLVAGRWRAGVWCRAPQAWLRSGSACGLIYRWFGTMIFFVVTLIASRVSQLPAAPLLSTQSATPKHPLRLLQRLGRNMLSPVATIGLHEILPKGAASTCPCRALQGSAVHNENNTSVRRKQNNAGNDLTLIALESMPTIGDGGACLSATTNRLDAKTKCGWKQNLTSESVY